MIFATAKGLRKLSDTALQHSRETWSFAEKRYRAMHLIYLMLGGVAVSAMAAFVAPPTIFPLCVVYASVLSAACAGYPLTKYNAARLERENASRASAAHMKTEAEADWFPKMGPQPPAPPSDLGQDFRLGISRDVGVKPALKLINRATPAERSP
jgi:hypothetical protein